jgi:hypothetical protein
MITTQKDRDNAGGHFIRRCAQAHPACMLEYFSSAAELAVIEHFLE